MDSKFSPGDYVLYKGKVYIVESVALMNPSIPNDPFVCVLRKVKKGNSSSKLLVREGLLKLADSYDAIKKEKSNED